MAALTVAKNNLVKGMAPMEGLFKDLLEREFITQDSYDRIRADEDLAHYFKSKAKGKKAGAKKAPKKVSANLQERNEEKFDDCRCFARKWEAEGGLGYDSIQCSSCKKVPSDEAEKVMEEFKEKMDEDQLASLPEYLEKYDGCFCKNHLKQDFFMPNGWWLGKVNEDRPEKPMLPKGSFKDGYQEEYKEHRWMFDEEGNKNERISNRGRTPKKLVIEDDDEEKKVEEVEEEKKDRPYMFEGIEYTEVWDEDDKEWLITFDGEHVGGHFLGRIRFADDDEEKAHAGRVAQIEEVEDVPEEDTLKLPEEDKEEEEEEEEEEEDHEDKPHMIDGIEYTLMWDEDDKEWLVTFDDEHVGWPGNGGAGIRFADDDEEKAHADRVVEKE
jgi:hypothetical protein